MRKNSNSRILMQFVVLLLTCVAAFNASAATDKDAKERQAVHRLQLQLEAAQQEKTELATQLDAMKKQMGDLQSKLESRRVVLEKKLTGQTKQISDLSDKLQKTELADKQQQAEITERLQETEKKLKQIEQQYSTTSKNLQQTQAEKEQEKKQLDGEIQVCKKKNAELYALSVNLLDKYKNKGVMDAINQVEPFTQLEKVKVENLLQDFRDKADANRIASESSGAQDVQRP